MELKDKAKAKLERRAAKSNENRTTKGPQIAWDQPGGVNPDTAATPPAPADGVSLVPTDDSATPDTKDE